MADNIKVRMITTSSPSNPPMMQRKDDSSRNSVMMVIRLAPMAFLSPICDVRSRTVTNMILATPNIPTMSERVAMAQPPLLTPSKMLVAKLAESIDIVEREIIFLCGFQFTDGAHGAEQFIFQLLERDIFFSRYQDSWDQSSLPRPSIS